VALRVVDGRRKRTLFGGWFDDDAWDLVQKLKGIFDVFNDTIILWLVLEWSVLPTRVLFYRPFQRCKELILASQIW
jgi:hypothetical protein